MTSTRPMQRLSSIALLAIPGGHFTAGEASASDTRGLPHEEAQRQARGIDAEIHALVGPRP